MVTSALNDAMSNGTANWDITIYLFVLKSLTLPFLLKPDFAYPPKYVDLSSMWVYLVVRFPWLTQEERYQRRPSVFPSKEPLRQSWTDKGKAPEVWSDVRNKWVYPIVFGKYQLHGEEGSGQYDVNQATFINSTGTHATQDIAKGADCVLQQPPAAAGSTIRVPCLSKALHSSTLF